MKTLATISGTSRPNNFTSRALAVVNTRLHELGVEPTEFDARNLDLNFPGQPVTDDAKRLREVIAGVDAVIIATPEYHGSFAAMTKLIIESLGFPSALEGKAVSLLGVASGRIGAIKSLEQLRGVCAHVGAVVLPGSVSVAGVQNAFDDDGNSTNENITKMLHGLAENTVQYLDDYVCPRQILETALREDADAEPWTTTL